MNNRKEFYKNVMRPLSNKRLFKYDFIGFDVETYGEHNKFLMGGLYFYDKKRSCDAYVSFWDKQKMIDFIVKNNYFKGKYIVATNLSFDFTTLFYNTKEWNNFKIINKGSDIILATRKYKDSSHKGCLKFIDTFSYVKFGVEKIGKIIGLDKIKHPSFLGKKITSLKDKREMEEYNKMDCKISCDFMYFLQKGINKAGGKLKVTIASCSLDIWRRNFLKEIVIKENFITKNDTKKFIFEGYYGGRTEAFKRGKFKNVYYYDINSLYPSVMKENYPLPNSIKEINTPSIRNIIYYMGVSECIIETPKGLNKPLLPYRTKDKLIFPIGKFTGTYNHNELKKALELGYKISPIKQIIYTKTWKPFNNFVDYFYNERLKFKNQNNSMEYIMKLILNSLYGKFAQKELNTWRIVDIKGMGKEKVDKLLDGDNKEFEFNHQNMDLVMIRQKHSFNGVHSFPILSSYVTSYARIKMYDYLKDDDVIYTDTDSIITKSKKYEDSKELGKMKIEGFFNESFIVRPKFYYCEGKEGNQIKIKGLSKANMNDFLNILEGQKIGKTKFTKMRESFKRGFSINQIVVFDKEFNLNDDKRNWTQTNKTEVFKDKLFISEPLEVET